MASNPSAKRRWLLLALLFLVLVALGGGAWYVIRRGTYREGLYEKALRALHEGRREDGEQQLRYIVESNPSHRQAKSRLALLLAEDRRFEEIEDLARDWVEKGQDLDLTWRIRIENAFRMFRFDDAVEFARAIADLDPEYAQATMARARDFRGTFWDRLEAQRMAVSLASSSESDRTKAGMLLFAAETLLELRTMAPESARDSMLRQARTYLEQGRAALRRARQTGQVPEADLLRARMQIHSELEAEREVGLQTLELILRNDPADHQTRAALASYHTQRGNWEEAERLVGELGEEAFLLWLRAVRSLGSLGRKDEVLRLLENAPFPDAAAVSLVRAQALLQGDEEERKQAAAVLTDLLQRSESDPTSAMQAFRLLSAGGQREAGLQMLETINEATPDTRIEALLAGALPATGVERERALERIEKIAARVEDMPQSVQVMRMLRQGDEAALLTYLGAQIELGGLKGRLHRLLRALSYATLASREQDVTKAAAHKEAAVEDLTALLGDPEADKSLLASAWRVALLARDVPLAGRLCARAVGMDGAPYNLALSCVLLARRLRDAEMRSDLAQGLRGGAERAAALIEALANFVEQEQPADLGPLRTAVEQAKSDPGSETPVLFLLVQLAHLEEDFEPAEARARELVERLPDSPLCAAMLGEYLLRRRQFDEVLEVTEAHAEASVQIGWLRVSSLRALDRKEEALTQARDLVRRFPKSAAAHLVLAGTHQLDRRDTEALAVLGMAPQTRNVLIRRAGLLEQRDERQVAEMLYWAVLERAPADVEAWQGIGRLMMLDNREVELIEKCSKVIDAEGLPFPVKCELRILRALAQEQLGRTRDALIDYEVALRFLPFHVIALNNAAWLISQEQPERIEEAKGYIDKVLAMNPRQPEFWDTAAAVYLVLGRHDKALGHINKALEIGPAPEKEPAYMVRRARILIAMGRKPQAAEQLKVVLDRYPKTPQSIEAGDLLRQLSKE
jgi:tetratricopeptide (TPR) repeat protein